MSIVINTIQAGSGCLPSQDIEKEKPVAQCPSHDEGESAPALIPAGPFAGLPMLPESSLKSSLPYLFCNETCMDKTLAFLKAQNISSNSSLHIGFSLWFNLDIISVTKPSLALICDIDSCIMDLFRMIASCVKKAPSRSVFVENFIPTIYLYLRKATELSSDKALADCFHFDKELSRAQSWLSSDAQFEVVKKMFEEERILFQNLDLTDSSENFSLIHKWMQEKSLTTSTFYVSNILEWVQQSSFLKQEQALRNLRSLVTDNTFFIQAYSPSYLKKKLGPQQVVTQGSLFIQLPKMILRPQKAKISRLEGSK